MATFPTFFQGGVSPFRTLLGSVRPLNVEPIDPGVITSAAAVVNAHLYDATANFTPTAFADVRASNATFFGSSSILRTAGSNGARLELDPATTSVLGLLVEDTATNLYLHSGDMTNATDWSDGPGGVTRSTDGTLLPDGVTAACKVTNVASSTVHILYNVTPSTITSGATYTRTAYVRAGTHNFVNFYFNGPTTHSYVAAVFDISGTSDISSSQTSTGLGGVLVSATGKYIGRGWYRLTLVGSITDSTAYTGFGFAPAATGNTFGTGGDLIFAGTTSQTLYWGFPQLETGSVGTSFILTTTAATTRAADAYSFTLGASTTDLQFTFDDGSTQSVSGLTPGSTYTIPTNLSRSHILYIDAASSVVLTLAAGAGSFNLTGNAATIIINEPVVVGSYALTGNTAVPKVVVPAVADSYSLTGNSASLIANRKLLAASGSFALNGQNATEVITQPVLSGSYAMTGNAAVLMVKEPAVSGSYALTGFSATESLVTPVTVGAYALTGNSVVPNVVLPGARGSYALTGNPAALIANRVLLAASGAYALTGNPATLQASLPASQGLYTITGGTATILGVGELATAGSYALSGNAASIFLHRALLGGSGAYALTGHTATITLRATSVAGNYALTGNAATLQATIPAQFGAYSVIGFNALLNAVMPAADGSYSLTGFPATIVAAGPKTLFADHGSFLLNGQPATLAYNRNLALASGIYTLTGFAATIGEVIPATYGAYALTGNTAVLSALRALSAASGSYLLAGNAADLSQHRIAVSGSYVITGYDAFIRLTRVDPGLPTSRFVWPRLPEAYETLTLTTMKKAFSHSNWEEFMSFANRRGIDDFQYPQLISQTFITAEPVTDTDTHKQAVKFSVPGNREFIIDVPDDMTGIYRGVLRRMSV